MKRLFILVAVTAAIAAIVTATAEARGYTCHYRSGKVTATIDGYGNSAALCRSFNSGFGGTRVGWHTGRSFCAWRMRLTDVRVTVYSSSSSYGRLFCTILASKVGSDFVRIY